MISSVQGVTKANQKDWIHKVTDKLIKCLILFPLRFFCQCQFGLVMLIIFGVLNTMRQTETLKLTGGSPSVIAQQISSLCLEKLQPISFHHDTGDCSGLKHIYVWTDRNQ